MADAIESGGTIAGAVFRFLWPRRSDHGLRCYPWKAKVAISIMGLCAAFSILAVVAYGGAERIGVHGFVTTDKFAALTDKVDFLTRKSISDEIQETYGKMCMATNGQRRDLQRKLSELQIQYKTWFKSDYPPLEPC